MMDEPKKFQKQKLNEENYKNMEQRAKYLKGGLGLAGSFGLIYKNKDNIKAIGKGFVTVATKIIKK